MSFSTSRATATPPSSAPRPAEASFPIQSPDRQSQESLSSGTELPLLKIAPSIDRIPALESSYKSSFVSHLPEPNVSSQEKMTTEKLASLAVKTDDFLQTAEKPDNNPIDQSSDILNTIQKYLDLSQKHYEQYLAPSAPGAAVVRGYSGNLGAVDNYLALVDRMQATALAG